jgi:hypothetical protein
VLRHRSTQVSSISGSDTEDSEDEEEEDAGSSGEDASAAAPAAEGRRRPRRQRDGGGGKAPQLVFALPGEQAPHSARAPPCAVPGRARRASRFALCLTWCPPLAPPSDGTPLAVWRCLLYPDHMKARPPDSELLPALRRVRAACLTWVVLLLRGGHFAGAVFRMRPGPPGKGQHAGDPFEVVAHKTLHRYVVRCAGRGAGARGAGTCRGGALSF